MSSNNKPADADAQPWWRFGHVWLVLAGPAVVVVAGFVTLYLAIRTPDPVVSGQGGSAIVRPEQSGEAAGSTSLAPAVQARNHAATGEVPPPKPPSR